MTFPHYQTNDEASISNFFFVLAYGKGRQSIIIDSLETQLNIGEGYRQNGNIDSAHHYFNSALYNIDQLSHLSTSNETDKDTIIGNMDVVFLTKGEMQKEDAFIIKIQDHGEGLSEYFDFRNSKSFGLKLVHSLIGQ